MFEKMSQKPGEIFDDFVLDLKLLSRDLGVQDTDKLFVIPNVIACRSSDERVRQRCVEKGANLTLDDATETGRTFESANKSMQLLEEEDSKITAYTVQAKKATAI